VTKKEDRMEGREGKGWERRMHLFAISIVEEILQHEDHIGARKYLLWEKTPRCS